MRERKREKEKVGVSRERGLVFHLLGLGDPAVSAQHQVAGFAADVAGHLAAVALNQGLSLVALHALQHARHYKGQALQAVLRPLRYHDGTHSGPHKPCVTRTRFSPIQPLRYPSTHSGPHKPCVTRTSCSPIQPLQYTSTHSGPHKFCVTVLIIAGVQPSSPCTTPSTHSGPHKSCVSHSRCSPIQFLCYPSTHSGPHKPCVTHTRCSPNQSLCYPFTHSGPRKPCVTRIRCSPIQSLRYPFTHSHPCAQLPLGCLWTPALEGPPCSGSCDTPESSHVSSPSPPG